MSKIFVAAICPSDMCDDANSLAMVLTPNPDDGPDSAATYAKAKWQDASGNAYAVAGFWVDADWLTAAQMGLSRPVWDVEPYQINMAGAERAQAALVFWDGTGPIPQAAPDKLTALAAGTPRNAQTALVAAGLTRVELDL